MYHCYVFSLTSDDDVSAELRCSESIDWQSNLHIQDTCRRHGNLNNFMLLLSPNISSAQMHQYVYLHNSFNFQATDKLKTPL